MKKKRGKAKVNLPKKKNGTLFFFSISEKKVYPENECIMSAKKKEEDSNVFYSSYQLLDEAQSYHEVIQSYQKQHFHQ